VDKGLKVTWDSPSELDGQPVDSYSIGYGKSMKSLRFVTVDKDRRSELLEDVGESVNQSFFKWKARDSHWVLQHYGRLSRACCVVLEPGVLHFLKMSAENKDGMSKPVYRAETPGGVCLPVCWERSACFYDSLFSSLCCTLVHGYIKYSKRIKHMCMLELSFKNIVYRNSSVLSIYSGL